MRKSHIALLVLAAVCAGVLFFDRHTWVIPGGVIISGAIVWAGTTALLSYRYIHYKKKNPPLSLPEKAEPLGPGLVAQWQFDDICKGTAPDSSGHALHGKLERDLNCFLFPAASLTPGIRSKALLLKGRQWVAVPNKPCFSVEQFTVTAWVWRTKTEFKKGQQLVPTIIAKSTWAANGWWLCADINSQDIDMGIAWGEWFTHVKSGYTLPFEEWHFIGVTMDNINHEVQFFIDGKPYGEKIGGVKQWVTNWDRKLYIGEYDGSCRWPWEGKLADIRFYNLILSEREIAEIYKQAGTNQNSEHQTAAAV